MKDHDLYKRFVDTYRLLCDDIDRLDESEGVEKEIVLEDLGCDLSYLRSLIDEVYGGEELVNKVRKIKFTWTERIMFWTILLFGCIGGEFAGRVFGNFIKELLGL